MDKSKVRWNQGREVGMAGVGGDWQGGKCRQLYLNNNKIYFLKSLQVTKKDIAYQKKNSTARRYNNYKHDTQICKAKAGRIEGKNREIYKNS